VLDQAVVLADCVCRRCNRVTGTLCGNRSLHVPPAWHWPSKQRYGFCVSLYSDLIDLGDLQTSDTRFSDSHIFREQLTQIFRAELSRPKGADL